MKCNNQDIHEMLPDLAAGLASATPEVNDHLRACSACTETLAEFRKTMTLLDEWQTPEPSPYFDTRLQARLREEMARPAAGWLSWMRRPAWAMSLAAMLFAGALTIGIGGRSIFVPLEAIRTDPPALGLPVQPGTAVGDLQALE